MNPASRRLVEALCGLLNRLVPLDPGAGKGLRKLEGRSLLVVLRGPGLSLCLTVEEQRFRPGQPDDAGARIEASPGVLLGLAAGGNAPAGRIEISGDADTAQRFQSFFQDLRPDLEEGLSQLFGDAIGVRIARVLTGAWTQARRVGETLSDDLGDYLREESDALVRKGEMDEFLDAVDDLRDDVERLEQRIGKLGPIE